MKKSDMASRMANFLLDAAAFRMALMDAESTSHTVAADMIINYLQPGSKGGQPPSSSTRPPSLCRKLDTLGLVSRSSWKWQDHIVYDKHTHGKPDSAAAAAAAAAAETSIDPALKAGQTTANTPPSSFRRGRSITTNAAMPIIPIEDGGERNAVNNPSTETSTTVGAASGSSGTRIPTAEELMRSLNTAELFASNALGMRGQPVDDLLSILVDGKLVGQCERSPFDFVDHLVFTCLRDKYFSEFMESQDWKT